MKYRIPAVLVVRAFVEEGGLMIFVSAEARHVPPGCDFVDKIVKGARPGDLPVQQPTKFGPIMNMKTAKAIGLTVPPAFLARVDEVIE